MNTYNYSFEVKQLFELNVVAHHMTGAQETFKSHVQTEVENRKCRLNSLILDECTFIEKTGDGDIFDNEYVITAWLFISGSPVRSVQAEDIDKAIAPAKSEIAKILEGVMSEEAEFLALSIKKLSEVYEQEFSGGEVIKPNPDDAEIESDG